MPSLEGLKVQELVAGKRDSFYRPLFVDELFVGRLPAGPQKLCVPVGDELAGIPLIPVVAPELLQQLFVVHVLRLRKNLSTVRVSASQADAETELVKRPRILDTIRLCVPALSRAACKLHQIAPERA